MTRENILKEIEAERKYQEEKWGNETDDTVNAPNDWVTYIAHHSTRWFGGGFRPYPKSVVDTFRTQMIKTAAIAVAAVESIDRQRETSNTAFYENK